MTDDDGHYETKKSNISGGVWKAEPPEKFGEFRGILRIFLCNFKEFFFFGGGVWGGEAPRNILRI